MEEQFVRTARLLGTPNMEKLKNAKVLVFGVGGVGGFVVEALARAGVGSISIVDDDTVSISNINRQIIATWDTVGKAKVDVMKKRILSINPNAFVETHRCFYLPDTKDQFDFSKYDYIVDAIDTVTGKLQIIEEAMRLQVPVISSMGTGNKLDPTKLQIADIYKTSVCPLAKVMRHECKKRGIKKLKVLFSTELPLTPIEDEEFEENANVDETFRKGKPKKNSPGSVSFVPSAAGLIIASEVIKDITQFDPKNR